MPNIEVQPTAEKRLQNKAASMLLCELAIAKPKDHMLNATHIDKNNLFMFDSEFSLTRCRPQKRDTIAAKKNNSEKIEDMFSKSSPLATKRQRTKSFPPLGPTI